MASIKRRVGYCENGNCEVYAEEVFLKKDDDPFHCPKDGYPLLSVRDTEGLKCIKCGKTYFPPKVESLS